jgi:tetratricopeptide (TPR) repeat protein
LCRPFKDTKFPENAPRSLEKAERFGKVVVTLASSTNPACQSFADLLEWHLTRGTRPSGRPDVSGKQWTNKDFADRLGTNERTVRNWRRGRNTPVEIVSIERELFGDNQAYAAWREELRESHRIARASEGGSQAGDLRHDLISNVPIRVPRHFMGRDEALAAIETAFKRDDDCGVVAIMALHGLRGVGKTTLAAAYAEQHSKDYRVIWWIRAQAESGLRADLVALGIRLGWVDADVKEESAVATAIERLRLGGEGILLIFDNAMDAAGLKTYLPRGGAARVLVTSNAHAWRSIATPVEIRVWPKDIGADYLIARTGRHTERTEAEVLSETLGGLPLAHEQAAAYCERLEISLGEYRVRFEATPARFLDDVRHAAAEYGLTVARTFTLAIDQVAKFHPAAEPLIVHAALLAPDPIPLFLFAEAREQLGEPLASALAGEGQEEVVAALRAFALIDRETIVDERDASITIDTIRLHRLVREVAVARRKDDRRDQLRRALTAVLAAVYPEDILRNPASWPRCALLTPHLLSISETEMGEAAVNLQRADLLERAASYFHGRAAYSGAGPLYNHALAIREKTLGPEHPDTATSLNKLGMLFQAQGDLAGARPLYERALAIREKVLDPEHPDTATSLGNLAVLLQDQGDLVGARPLYERALAIREKVLGPEHPDTATSLNNLALLLQDQGDLVGARPLYERVLGIREKTLGPEHPDTALGLNGLALLLQDLGDVAGARLLYERVLAIWEKVLGPEHPDTAMSLNNLGSVLQVQGDLAGARSLYERALVVFEKAVGPDHPATGTSLDNLASLLKAQGDLAGARSLFERALGIREKMLGPEHPDTGLGLNNLAALLKAQGDLAGARPLFERALAVCEKALGPEHPNTNRVRHNFSRLLLADNRAAEALQYSEAALAAQQKSLGESHAWTKGSARATADALVALGRTNEAAALRVRYGIELDG